jgi:hypothetical protein
VLERGSAKRDNRYLLWVPGGRLEGESPMRSGIRPLCVLLTAGLLLPLCSAGGCGWTPRDEYLYNQQITLKPQAGDGSQIASLWEPKRSTGLAGAFRPVASAGPKRESSPRE